MTALDRQHAASASDGGRSFRSVFSFRFSVFAAPRGAKRGERAQAIVEYALVFPLQLMMTLAIIQLAHMFVAKQVLDYAAFCGARAKLVDLSDDDALRAAAIPISRIAGPAEVDAGDGPVIEVPGWGDLRGSDAAWVKTQPPYGSFEVNSVQVAGEPAIRCELTHLYELRVPIGNFVAYQIADVFLASDRIEKVGGEPHVRMRATCTLAKPWGN